MNLIVEVHFVWIL